MAVLPDPKPKLLANRFGKEFAHAPFGPQCDCVTRKDRTTEVDLHTEQQDTASEGWNRLLELIEEAVHDRREQFSPGRDLTPKQWRQIVTLPPSIARLKDVKHLILYGSSLVRIPPEIGEMSSLEEFEPYTSYQLHWFPYEITRCKKLNRSTVSTRALYGNYKCRPPFPHLPQLHAAHTPDSCSICDTPFGNAVPLQYWVSRGIATDVLPLLVHACSEECLSRIPPQRGDFILEPHQGGLALQQPPPSWQGNPIAIQNRDNTSDWSKDSPGQDQLAPSARRH